MLSAPINLPLYFFLALGTVPGIPQFFPALALAITAALPQPLLSSSTSSASELVDGLTFALALRASIVLSTFTHEWAHVLAAACYGHTHALWYAANWRCNVKLSAWVSSMNPLAAWHQDASSPHIRLDVQDKANATVIRLAGAMFSVLLAVAATAAVMTTTHATPLIHGAVLGTWMVAAGGLASDVLLINHSDGLFRCGNFGMLIINSAKKTSVDCVRTLQRMVAITSARGAQSGGVVTLCNNGSAYRCRFVPTKRQDLSVNLLFWFNIGLRLRNFFAWLSSIVTACFVCKGAKQAEANKQRLRDECRWFVGHTRFATSSAPTVKESHPHRFANPRMERIWRCDPTGRWCVSNDKFEMYITHNGDFEFWSLLGRLRTHADMAAWLRTVLKVTNTTAACDSTKVSGVMQYLRTQGMWFPSFRLAYQNVVQPPFETYASGVETLPSSELQAMAAVADEFFAAFVETQTAPLENQESITRFCTILANKLVGRGGPVIAQVGDCMDLATEATKCFLGNDLFTSLKFLLENAHGSFGLAACSTLDPNVVALASRGQPMSLALDAERGAVLWGSEASAQMVSLGREETPSNGSKGPRVQCQWRHDLEESCGEVVELLVISDAVARHHALNAGADGRCFQGSRFSPLDQQPQLIMRVYHGRSDSFATRESFCQGQSLVALLDNPHVDPLPPQLPGPRRVAADIDSIPPVLARIRSEWDDPDSRACQTAGALYEALQRKAGAVSSNQCGRLEIDVLVMAVEASLWIGEQFASDLQGMFPRLRIVPLSANKICGVFSNHQGADAMTGFSFSSTTMALKNAVVIAISHSGQTFPTMHATHTLRKICGDKVFVVAGSIDSKMSAAVGQMAHDSAPWVSRVITTFAGWRPSEALTVSTVACHHTLTELLLFLGTRANESEPMRRMAGVLVSSQDLDDIQRLNFNFVTKTAPETVGATLDGERHPTPISKSLRAQGRHWALHVLEGPHAWCLSAAYILGTVVASSPPFLAIKNAIWGDGSEDGADEAWRDQLKYVALALDSLVYMFLPLLWSLVLRLLQGRELRARLGKRTLVVGDVPYVHQLLESYVSKLFAQSYSIASIDVHGANPIDHLVHRFTHRVTRGVLLAIGRPDGRLFSQTKAESWILMAMQQAKAIVHLGSPPEVITVGHNPYKKASVMDAAVVLSQERPRFICETIPALSAEEDTEPMKRMAAFKHSVGVTDGSQDLHIDVTEPRASLPIGSYLLQSINHQTKANYALLQHLSAAAVDDSCRGIRSLDASAHGGAKGGGVGSGVMTRPNTQRTFSGDVQDLSGRGDIGRAALAGLRAQSRDVSMHRDSPWQAREVSQHNKVQATNPDDSIHSILEPLFQHITSGDPSGHAALPLRGTGSVPPSELLNALSNFAAERTQSTTEAGARTTVGNERAMAEATHSLQDMLNHCTALETWYENRYASVERYMSMLVLFHAMADRVAAFLPLHFDTSRSQSQLRVATTAAPISAADIQHEWAEAPSRPLLHRLHPVVDAPELPAPAALEQTDEPQVVPTDAADAASHGPAGVTHAGGSSVQADLCISSEAGPRP